MNILLANINNYRYQHDAVLMSCWLLCQPVDVFICSHGFIVFVMFLPTARWQINIIDPLIDQISTHQNIRQAARRANPSKLANTTNKANKPKKRLRKKRKVNKLNTMLSQDAGYRNTKLIEMTVDLSVSHAVIFKAKISPYLGMTKAWITFADHLGNPFSKFGNFFIYLQWTKLPRLIPNFVLTNDNVSSYKQGCAVINKPLASRGFHIHS